MSTPDSTILAAVGNTRIRVGRWSRREVVDACSFLHDEIEALPDQATALLENATLCAISSVNRPAAERLEAALARSSPGCSVMRIGRDIPVRLQHTLDDASTLGQDRLMNAVAARARAGQACVIVDAGTAVTVDFIDGEGVFHGGVIAPGVHLMLDALHRLTDALPSLSYEPPDPEQGPFGRDTPHAMRLGVRACLIGLVRTAAEQFAEHYGAYPQIIATGGDAPILEQEGIIEHFVPDLQLLGIGLCLDAPDTED